MHFHDSRGMLEAIAEWLDSFEVEIDWQAIMQCKWWVGPKDWVPPSEWSMPPPFPSRLTPPLATKLLFAQWWSRLSIGPEVSDPLDDYVAPRMTSHQSDQQNVVPKNQLERGGEGVDRGPAGDPATGPSSWKIFLKHLATIDRIELIELKMVTAEERRMLVRMAWIEEELRRREVEHNRERVMRQSRGEAKWTLSRKSEEWLRGRACRGNLACIEEMERKGYGSAEEHGKWRELNKRLVEGAAANREKLKAKRLGNEKEEGVEESDKKAVNASVIITVSEETRTVSPVPGAEVDAEIEDNEVDTGAESSLGVKGKVLSCPGAVGVAPGIEREVEVIRVGPNPRILTCRYWELASERSCKVRVKDSSKFVRGMRIRVVEPKDERAYRDVWEYAGPYPRYRGRW